MEVILLLKKKIGCLLMRDRFIKRIQRVIWHSTTKFDKNVMVSRLQHNLRQHLGLRLLNLDLRLLNLDLHLVNRDRQ